MDVHNDNLINEADNEYIMPIKSMQDILEDLHVGNDEYLITKSIITNLEKFASDNIKNGIIVGLPNIGRIRKKPLHVGMSKHYAEFKTARKHMNIDEYKAYVKSVASDIKERDVKAQSKKRVIKKLKSKNKGTYEKLVSTLGFGYANLWIKSILLLGEVPFNQDIQDEFDRLNNK